jgi:WD40 repeat protein
VAFAEDPNNVIMLTESSVIVWPFNGTNNDEIYPVNAKENQVSLLGPRGKYVVYEDRDTGELTVCDWQKRQVVYQQDFRSASIFSLYLSPDNRWLIVGLIPADTFGSDWSLALVDLLGKKVTQSHRVPIYSNLAVNASQSRGLLLSSNSNSEIFLIPTVNRGSQCRLALKTPSWCMATFPNGNLLATGTEDGEIQIWELATRLLCDTLPSHQQAITSVTCSPNGTLVVSTSHDSNLCIWDLVQRKCCRIIHHHPQSILFSSFSPCGKLLATGSRDGYVTVFNIDDHYPCLSLRHDGAQLDREWNHLMDRDGQRALQAIRYFLECPDSSVTFFSSRLLPVAPCDSQEALDTIRRLDNHDFRVRRLASQKLVDMDEPALPFLEAALQQAPSLHMRRSLSEIISRIESDDPSPRQLQTLRAITILETLDTSKAVSILRRLAKGSPRGTATREASAALARINNRCPSRK